MKRQKVKGKMRVTWWRDGCIWSIDMRECRIVCDHYYTRETSARRAARMAARKLNIGLEDA